MTDLHCHILPGLDDGSSSLEESVEMAHIALESGVNTICTTPHFLCTDEEEGRVFLEASDASFRALSEVIDRRSLRLVPGAEVLFTESTPDLLRRGLVPTLGSSPYMLTEFYFDDTIGAMEHGFEVISSFGLIPVIAHPERYNAVRSHPDAISRWFSYGYIIQVNKGSIIGTFGETIATIAEDIISHGLCHIVASDAHAADRRTTDMSIVKDALVQYCGARYANILLNENPSRILGGLAPVPSGTK